MLLRLIAGIGLVAFGYYIGRQVGRMEPIREELQRAREAQAEDTDSDRKQATAEAPDRSTRE
jgi:hypothetical protein